jgi:hypothetical protein
MLQLAGFRALGNVRYIRLVGKEAFHNSPKQFPLGFNKQDGLPRELRLGQMPRTQNEPVRLGKCNE